MDHGLWQYLCKRLLLCLITLLVILFSCYLLMRLAPGNAAKSSVLDSSGGAGMVASDRASLEQSKVLEEKLHLDKPLIVGFGIWLADAMKGDFGTSVEFEKGRPVTELIMERLPVTVKLNFFAILLTYLLAIPLGILTAVSPNPKLDRTVTVGLLFLYALPVLFTALLLRAFFCQGGMYPIFPLTGLTPTVMPGTSTWQIMGQTALHYVLPVFCLSYGGFAVIARYTRAGMLDVIRQE